MSTTYDIVLNILKSWDPDDSQESIADAIALELAERLAGGSHDDAEPINAPFLASLGFTPDPSDCAFVRLRLKTETFPTFIVLSADPSSITDGGAICFSQFGAENEADRWDRDDFVILTANDACRTRGQLRRFLKAVGT